MTRYLRAAVAAALALAAVAGFAACGGSSGNSSDSDVGKLDTSATAAKCGMGNRKAATGKPIKVRALATASGGIDFSSAPRSAAAFFKCVNANGGINGRPIDYAYERRRAQPAEGGADRGEVRRGHVDRGAGG